MQRDIAAIIFSKDRAMQLDACLRSFSLYCPESEQASVSVLYTARCPEHQSAYDELIRHHDTVRFFRETHFKYNLLTLIAGSRLVMFLTDDTIFVRPAALYKAADALGAQDTAIGFSFRLGRNITYCYPIDSPQSAPASERISGHFLRFDWTAAEHDFGYPLELSSSLYRTADIAPLIRSLQYHNPNTLETELSVRAPTFAATRPHLLCCLTSAAFTVPANVVQDGRRNRSDVRSEQSADRLLAEFTSGLRISLEPLHEFIPRACHQEIDFAFSDARIADPKVSVVIVNHNYAAYLAEAIESALAQTYTNFEIIVVDNGSDDGSASIAVRYRDNARGIPLRVIRNDENVGSSAARRQGIAASRAKYVLPLDADDVLGHRYLEETVGAMDSNPRAGVAYVDALTFGEENHLHFQEDYSLSRLSRSNFFASCSLMRRRAYDAAGGYDPGNWGFFEDWDLWLSLGVRGWHFLHVPKILLNYRAHQSLSKRNTPFHDHWLAYVRLRHANLYTAEQRARDRELLRSMPEGWHRRPPVTDIREIAAFIRRFHPVNAHWMLALANAARTLDFDQADGASLRDLLGEHHEAFLGVLDTAQKASGPVVGSPDITVFLRTTGRPTLAKSHYSIQRQTGTEFVLKIIPGTHLSEDDVRQKLTQCRSAYFIVTADDVLLAPWAMARVRKIMSDAPNDIGVIAFLLWDKDRRIPVRGLSIWRASTWLLHAHSGSDSSESVLESQVTANGHRWILFPEMVGIRAGRFSHMSPYRRLHLTLRNTFLLRILPSDVRRAVAQSRRGRIDPELYDTLELHGHSMLKGAAVKNTGFDTTATVPGRLRCLFDEQSILLDRLDDHPDQSDGPTNSRRHPAARHPRRDGPKVLRHAQALFLYLITVTKFYGLARKG